MHSPHWRTGSAAWFSLCPAILFAVVALPMSRADDAKPVTASAHTKPTVARAQPASLFDLRIVGPDGKPISEAKVEVQTNPAMRAEQIRVGRFRRRARYGVDLTSDATGRVLFDRPVDLKRLDIYIRVPGYAYFWAGWDLQTNSEPIADSLTAKLEPAWTVGGIVVDEQGKPIPNVRISFITIEFTKRPGNSRQLSIGDRRWTNNKGEWTFESVPVSLNAAPIQISDPNFVGKHTTLPRVAFGIERGHRPTAKIELKPALVVTGKVTDESGKPIAKARVRTRFMNERRSALTGTDGSYRLEGCEPGEARIVASAKGRAMDLQTVRIAGNMKPVDFQLKPGRTIRVRILDERGNPVPKAQIFFQEWRGHVQYFEFDQVPRYADEHGVWEWNEAPSDELKADIGRRDGMCLSERPFVARDDEYVFRVPPALVISGKVVDAATKLPIKKFRVVPGNRWGTALYWQPNSTFSAVDGQYRLRESYEVPAYLVKIEADGYLSSVSREIKCDEGNVVNDFELVKDKKEVALTVLTPESVPAAGAKVALAIARGNVRIADGQINSRDSLAWLQETDAAGRCHVTPQAPEFWLVVTHPSGYVQLAGLPNTNPGVIKLDRWARVEGTLRIARKIQPHVDLAIDRVNQSFGQDLRILAGCQGQTNGNGRFVFERVVPGRARIGREFDLSSRDASTGMMSWSWVTTTFPPGKTTHIDLGMSGRPVIGQLRPAPDAKDETPWIRALANLRADDPRPVDSEPSFIAIVDRDGNFSIDDVPVGNYVLSVQIINQGPRLTDHRFSVPPINEKLWQKPVDLGVLTLSSRKGL